MKKLQAVFWDVDGTIADTEMNGHLVAFNRSFEQYGLKWKWNNLLYQRLLEVSGGKNRIKYYADYKKINLSNEQVCRIHSIKQEIYKSLVNSRYIKLRPGVERLICELNDFNIKQFIVTTSSRKSAEPLLESIFNNHEDYFEGMITSEDVIRTKPDPEAYITAITKSNTNYSDIIVIEDSLQGLKASLSANLRCLVTLSPWLNNISEYHQQASAVVNNLGTINNSCFVYKGPDCSQGMINKYYLELLLNLDIL